jgi:hypothetical protein
VASDTLSLVNEDHTHTAAYRLKTPRLDAAIADLRPEFSDSFPDQRLATVVLEKNKARVERRLQLSEEIVGYSRMSCCIVVLKFLILSDLRCLGGREEIDNTCEQISQLS